MSRPRATGPTTEVAALPQAGIYIIQVRLPEAVTLRVGRLGWIPFDAGDYVYVGSAVRHLRHRLARHLRHDKVLRWHIDYLTVVGRVSGVWVWPPHKQLECLFATKLAEQLEVVSGFGCSDCGCKGHLFRGTGEAARSILSREHTPVAHCRWQ